MKETIPCEHIEKGEKTAFRWIPLGGGRYVELCPACEAALKGQIIQEMINEAVKDFVKGMFHR